MSFYKDEIINEVHPSISIVHPPLQMRQMKKILNIGLHFRTSQKKNFNI